MELGKRTLTAFVLLSAVFVVIQYASGIVFFLLLQVFVLGALAEFYALAARKKLRPRRALGMVLAATFAASFYVRGFGFAAALFAGLLLTCVYYVVHVSTLEKLATFPQSIAVTFFGALYLSFTLNYMFTIRAVYGAYPLYFLFAVVFLGDTGAFFIGKPFGKHKMTPVASPNKSWEGSAGGILFACLGAWAARELLLPDVVLWRALLVAVLVHAAAQASDPLESLFKRAVGVKDSSNVLPGHGGFLDRIDSLILAAPLFYYLVGILWK
jgi:phosphatidate cytidylyltransferase